MFIASKSSPIQKHIPIICQIAVKICSASVTGTALRQTLKHYLFPCQLILGFLACQTMSSEFMKFSFLSSSPAPFAGQLILVPLL